jgi:hypothetical protein
MVDPVSEADHRYNEGEPVRELAAAVLRLAVLDLDSPHDARRESAVDFLSGAELEFFCEFLENVSAELIRKGLRVRGRLAFSGQNPIDGPRAAA